MKVQKVIVGRVRTNCYIVSEDDRCVIIDPGADADRIKQFITENCLQPQAILLTHGHFDHIMAVDVIRDFYEIKVYAPVEERDLLKDCRLNCSYDLSAIYETEADVYVRDGETIEVAGMSFTVIHTPGHTKGSSCYYVKAEKALFAGDTLFFRSVGRTDLPTGDTRTLMSSLNKLMELPVDTCVYCGHGPKTDIGSEKIENPYIRG